MTRDSDPGLDAGIIRPALFTNRIRTQEPVKLGSVLDLLCLTEDAKHALGGVPKGCTIAFAGPPGKGKTRSALGGLARVAAGGDRVHLWWLRKVSRRGRERPRRSCSRMCKIGMAATGLDEKKFTRKSSTGCSCWSAVPQGTTGTTSWGSTVTLVEKEADQIRGDRLAEHARPHP